MYSKRKRLKISLTSLALLCIISIGYLVACSNENSGNNSSNNGANEKKMTTAEYKEYFVTNYNKYLKDINIDRKYTKEGLQDYGAGSGFNTSQGNNTTGNTNTSDNNAINNNAVGENKTPTENSNTAESAYPGNEAFYSEYKTVYSNVQKNIDGFYNAMKDVQVEDSELAELNKQLVAAAEPLSKGITEYTTQLDKTTPGLMDKSQQEFITGLQGVEGVPENYRTDFDNIITKIKGKIGME